MTRLLLAMRSRLWLVGAVLATASVPAAHAQTSPGSPTGAAEDRAMLQAALRHRAIGSDSAKVVIYFFSDYACPDCAQFVAQRMDSLVGALVTPGAARIVHASFLIPRLLRGWQGATAAFCIAALTDVATFDEAARRIFAEQGIWATARDAAAPLRAIARDVGADPVRFDDCVIREVMAPLILADIRAGFSARVTGTPRLVLLSAAALADRTRDPFDNAVSFPGNAPLSELRAAVARLSRTP
jgi:protein-disulfide isomerase